ncbi:MAG: AAA family ATPase [Chthoniobacteraceae bacterium]
MIDLNLPLIGPIVEKLAAVRELIATNDRLAVLFHGDPGVAKSHGLDLLAMELTGSKFAIEQVNGQSVDVATVRQWRERGYGNLFSKWTVKRIDELDKASDAAQAELLSWLDYQPRQYALLATTNDYKALCRVDKGRLQRRFKQYRVDAPGAAEASLYLQRQFGVPPKAALTIAKGAVPEGMLDGVNMGAAVEDAQAYLAARSARKKAA